MKLKLTLALILIVCCALAQVKEWSLKECVDLALKNNIDLKQTENNNKQNLVNLNQAKANLLPSLNISDGQGFSFGRSIDPFSNQFVNQNIKTNNLSVNSALTLFGGMQNVNTIRQSKLNYESGNLDLKKFKNDITLNVTAAYLQLLMAEEQLETAKKQLAPTTEQLNKTEIFVKAGKLTELSLFQVQSQLASDKLGVTNGENLVSMTRLVLKQLLEIPAQENFEIQKPSTEAEITGIQQPEQVYNAALENQPQVKSSKIKTLSTLTGLQLAKSGLLPRLTLSGSLRTGYSSARKQISYQEVLQQQNGFIQGNPSESVVMTIPTEIPVTSNYPVGRQFNDNLGQSVSLNLSIPVFNNWQVKSNLTKAKLNIENSKLNEQAIKNQLRKDVEQAYNDAVSSGKKYLATSEQFHAEERSYQTIQKQFEVGLTNMVDFIIEKNNYQKAVIVQLQAKYDYIFKRKLLDFYFGIPISL